MSPLSAWSHLAHLNILDSDGRVANQRGSWMVEWQFLEQGAVAVT